MMIIRRVMLKIKIIHLKVNLYTYSIYTTFESSISTKDCNGGLRYNLIELSSKTQFSYKKKVEIESRPLMGMSHTTTVLTDKFYGITLTRFSAYYICSSLFTSCTCAAISRRPLTRLKGIIYGQPVRAFSKQSEY